MAKLVLLFAVVPVVELWLLISIGQAVGFWPTLAFMVGSAVLGTALAKREGLRVLSSWQEATHQGRVPDEGLTGALLLLIGAALFIVPGVLTDLVGLMLLLPPARRWIGAAVRERFERRMTAPSSAGGGLDGIGAGAGGAASWSVRVVDFGGGEPFAVGGWNADETRAPDGRPGVIDVTAEVVEESVNDTRVKRLLP